MRSTCITLVALAAAACGRSAPERAGAESGVAVRDSTRAAVAAESLAAQRDEWNVPEVVKRLSEAGLVVTAAKDTVRQPYLQVPGTRIQVSGSELDVYIYPSSADRERDSRQLDTLTGRPLAAARTADQSAHLIRSGNLLAVHTTLKDALAERVSNALTARHGK